MTKPPPQLMSGLKTTDIYFLEAGKSKIKMWAGLVSFEASLFGLQTAALPTDCLPSLLADVLIFSYCVYAKLLQSCPTLCDPMDYSPPGSSVHGISQARILEWFAISFSGNLHNPGIEPMSPALQANSL